MITRVDAPVTLRPSRVEVDLEAIRHNVRRFRSVAGVEVCAVVKANGYGHGMVPVARAALDAGATWLAVALVEDGIELRREGLDDVPVLLLSEPPLSAIPYILDLELTPIVYRAPFIAALEAAGHARDRPVDVHVKADTGMARVGVPEGEWEDRLEQLAVARWVRVTGAATHLSRADEPSQPTTDEQLASFDRFLSRAAALGIHPSIVHTANSAGALLHPAARRTMVRPGIGIYGLSPGAEVDAADHDLEPALRVVSEVSHVKKLNEGAPVSYGHTWHAPHDGWLATVPIGYADGVPRAVSNRCAALVGGNRRPIVGRVTMDQLTLWCDDDPPQVGDAVVLLGEQGDDRVRVEEWAEAADTITYEIVTQLTARLPRHHFDGPVPHGQ
jgi:alanine racemase